MEDRDDGAYFYGVPGTFGSAAGLLGGDLGRGIVADDGFGAAAAEADEADVDTEAAKFLGELEEAMEASLRDTHKTRASYAHVAKVVSPPGAAAAAGIAASAPALPAPVRRERDARPLCTYFMAGGCRFGDGCRFRHAAADPAAVDFFESEIQRLIDADRVLELPAADAAAASISPRPSPSGGVDADLRGGGAGHHYPSQEPESARWVQEYPLDRRRGGGDAATTLPPADSASQLGGSGREGGGGGPGPASASSLATGSSSSASDASAAAAANARFEADAAAWLASGSARRVSLLDAAVAAGLAHDAEDAETALAMAERNVSRDIACSVCLEEVTAVPGRRFGLLTSCTHAFCLDCIRQWRGRIDLPVETTRSCPVCRRLSYLVVPCDRFVADEGRKALVSAEYHTAQRGIPCRNWNYGKGSCPFGSSCFYAHLNPDGSAAVAPKHTIRLDAEGKVGVGRSFKLSEFLFR